MPVYPFFLKLDKSTEYKDIPYNSQSAQKMPGQLLMSFFSKNTDTALQIMHQILRSGRLWRVAMPWTWFSFFMHYLIKKILF